MKLIYKLANMKLTVVGLFLLMVLTIWGTLYQADNGLYQAQQKFYSTWFFLAGGFIPFPGAQSVIALLIVNLTAATVVLFAKNRMTWGMFMTHAGLIMLLGAGAVTFYQGEESYLTLEEQEASNVSLSYRHWEIAAWTGPDAERQVSAADSDHLSSGDSLSFPNKNLSIGVELYYPNAVITMDRLPEFDGAVSPGGIVSFKEAPRNQDSNADRPCALLTVSSGTKQLGKIILSGEEINRPSLELDGKTYTFALRRKRSELPAVIKLLDFRKEMYPGTQIAKSYSSRVFVSGGGMDREVVISMNKPLRIEGFTFYQSSYRELPGGREYSTFSVVKNSARVLPYIATGVTFLGMLFHFTAMLIRRMSKRGKEVSS